MELDNAEHVPSMRCPRGLWHVAEACGRLIFRRGKDEAVAAVAVLVYL